jgi:hypothetical protein
VIRHKVEAKNPALWKTGTQKGRGSQWCNWLPTTPHKYGEEGVVIGVHFSPPTLGDYLFVC